MPYLSNFRDKVKIKLNDKEDEENKKTTDLTKDNAVNNETKNSVKNVVTNNNTNTNSNYDEIIESSIDDDPIKKLEEIEDRIDLLEFYEAPDSLGLEKKEVPVYDEDAEKEKIQKDLDNEMSIKRDDIENEFTTSMRELEDEKVNYVKEKQELDSSINDIYDKQSLNIESQSIKRGLARSSIVLGQLAEVESSRATDLMENMNDLNEKLNNVENQMAVIIESRDRALENLDIDYADELDERLEKSKEEYKKLYDEVIEFNNNVSKLEAEYKLKYESEKIAWKESVLDLTKDGYDEFRKKIQNAKFDYMVSYLSNFSKDDALNILTSNPNFKDLLGSDYKKVYEYLLSR